MYAPSFGLGRVSVLGFTYVVCGWANRGLGLVRYIIKPYKIDCFIDQKKKKLIVLNPDSPLTQINVYVCFALFEIWDKFILSKKRFGINS